MRKEENPIIDFLDGGGILESKEGQKVLQDADSSDLYMAFGRYPKNEILKKACRETILGISLPDLATESA